MLERVKKKLLDRRDTATSAGLFSQRDIYDKLLRTIRDPAADSAQLDPLAQAAGLKVSFAHAALLLLTLDPPFDPAGLWVAPMDSQTVSMAHNLLRDYLLNQKLGDTLTLDEEKGHFLIVLCPEADVCSTSAHMRQKLKEYLQMEASVGALTHEHYETEHFSCPKQRWKEFMDFRFRKGRGGVLCFAEKKDSAASSNTKKLSAKSFLTQIHGSADIKLLPPAVADMARQMSLQKISREDCLQLFLAVFYQISALLSVYGASESGLYEFCGMNLAKRLRQLQFLEDALPWFEGFTTLTQTYLAAYGKSKKSDDILAVIDYAQSSLHLPISLQDAANHIGISSSYLSTLFKKETGQSFTEFLTRLRMERAKEYLEDPSVYIYEVCERIGYTDPNYFCKVFKKYTGLSPEAYRKGRQA